MVANYPHQLAYFNTLAGGRSSGWRHLLQSNLSWGQDWLILRDWLCGERVEGPIYGIGDAPFRLADLGIPVAPVKIGRHGCPVLEPGVYVFDANFAFRDGSDPYGGCAESAWPFCHAEFRLSHDATRASRARKTDTR